MLHDPFPVSTSMLSPELRAQIKAHGGLIKDAPIPHHSLVSFPVGYRRAVTPDEVQIYAPESDELGAPTISIPRSQKQFQPKDIFFGVN